MASRALAVLAVAPPLALEALVLASAAAWAGPGVVVAAASPEALRALGLSVAVASAAALIAVAAAAPAAYVLSSRSGFAVNVVAAALSLPLVAPPVAVGFLALVFLSSTPIGRAVNEALGLVFTPMGAVAVQAAVVYPIALRLLMDVFSASTRGYIEVARTLGCSGTCLLTRVVLPLSWRGVAGVYGIAFARAMGEFGATVMVMGASPWQATAPVMIYLSFAAGDAETATALSLVTMLVGFAALTAYWLLAGGAPWRR